MKWRLTIGEGDVIPRGFGISHYRGLRFSGTDEWTKHQAVCYRVPINLIVGACRALAWSVRCPPWRLVEYKAARIEALRKEEYERGLVDGWTLHGGSHLTVPYPREDANA